LASGGKMVFAALQHRERLHRVARKNPARFMKKTRLLGAWRVCSEIGPGIVAIN